MKEFLIELFPNVYEMFGDLLDSIWQTFVMVGIAGIFGITIGTLLGISLVVSAKGGLYENDLFNNILGKIVNTIRSIPFVILIALMVSFNPAYLKIVEAYHTQRVADAIAEVYSNAAVPAFEVK